MLRPAKNIICTIKSMTATYPQCVWGGGEEIQILAALETDLGGSWEGVVNCSPALIKEAELSRGSRSGAGTL